MNMMLDSIKQSMDANAACAPYREAIAILEGIFGPDYPIANIAAYLDYGDIGDAPMMREMQYAQIICLLCQHFGHDEFMERMSEGAFQSIRADLWSGKLDCWIYQGH